MLYNAMGCILALNLGFLFQILSYGLENNFFSSKLRDKIQNGKPGFKIASSPGSPCMQTKNCFSILKAMESWVGPGNEARFEARCIIISVNPD